MKTNYHSPYAMVKYGEVGFKLAFLVSYDPDNNCYYGHCSHVHWRKALTDEFYSKLYKTKRKFTEAQVIHRWRKPPSVKAFERAIKKVTS